MLGDMSNLLKLKTMTMNSSSMIEITWICSSILLSTIMMVIRLNKSSSIASCMSKGGPSWLQYLGSNTLRQANPRGKSLKCILCQRNLSIASLTILMTWEVQAAKKITTFTNTRNKNLSSLTLVFLEVNSVRKKKNFIIEPTLTLLVVKILQMKISEGALRVVA
jgi:hypothetical protein